MLCVMFTFFIIMHTLSGRPETALMIISGGKKKKKSNMVEPALFAYLSVVEGLHGEGLQFVVVFVYT